MNRFVRRPSVTRSICTCLRVCEGCGRSCNVDSVLSKGIGGSMCGHIFSTSFSREVAIIGLLLDKLAIIFSSITERQGVIRL